MKWKLWYSDGSTFTHEDGSWEDAPSRGIVVLVYDDGETGREVEHGKDYYLWWEGRGTTPWGVDKAGLWDWLHEIGHPLADKQFENEDFATLEGLGVKFGRNMQTPDFRALLAEATMNDPEYPGP
jgi:hypothetical protein